MRLPSAKGRTQTSAERILEAPLDQLIQQRIVNHLVFGPAPGPHPPEHAYGPINDGQGHRRVNASAGSGSLKEGRKVVEKLSKIRLD
jgi:hypothetical protein